MRLTIQRIKLNSMGYDSRGRYWGVGDRLYRCPEVEELRQVTRCAWKEEAECRAPDLQSARIVFKRRVERMQQFPLEVS